MIKIIILILEPDSKTKVSGSCTSTCNMYCVCSVCMFHRMYCVCIYRQPMPGATSTIAVPFCDRSSWRNLVVVEENDDSKPTYTIHIYLQIIKLTALPSCHVLLYYMKVTGLLPFNLTHTLDGDVNKRLSYTTAMDTVHGTSRLVTLRSKVMLSNDALVWTSPSRSVR